MKRIPLTQGKFALVDDDDYSLLKEFTGKWCAAKGPDCWYAMGHQKGSGRGRSIRMHRYLCGALPNEHIDHKNGNGLDNRRANLRPATREQNGWNRGPLKNNTSGFKGVTKHPCGWIARITVKRDRIYLGLFNTPQAAGKAYKLAAHKYHGEFARVR